MRTFNIYSLRSLQINKEVLLTIYSTTQNIISQIYLSYNSLYPYSTIFNDLHNWLLHLT